MEARACSRCEQVERGRGEVGGVFWLEMLMLILEDEHMRACEA